MKSRWGLSPDLRAGHLHPQVHAGPGRAVERVEGVVGADGVGAVVDVEQAAAGVVGIDGDLAGLVFDLHGQFGGVLRGHQHQADVHAPAAAVAGAVGGRFLADAVPCRCDVVGRVVHAALDAAGVQVG